MSEVHLILQACQGNEEAWATLVGQHQEVIFRLAYLLLGDADEASDVAQETFIRAYQALPGRFDRERPLRPWLLQITANLARNRRRSLGRYWAALSRFFRMEAPAMVVPGPGESSMSAWEAQTLWQAVRRLSREDQEIICLRYFLELSVAETAETAGIAEGTVKSRLHRALGRLRTVVESAFPALQEERYE